MTPPELHYGDLMQVLLDTGLAGDDLDVEAWLRERGIVEPELRRYARELMEAATSGGVEGVMLLDGIFTSGLTLGIAIAERQAGDGSAYVTEAAKPLDATSRASLDEAYRLAVGLLNIRHGLLEGKDPLGCFVFMLDTREAELIVDALKRKESALARTLRDQLAKCAESGRRMGEAS